MQSQLNKFSKSDHKPTQPFKHNTWLLDRHQSKTTQYDQKGWIYFGNLQTIVVLYCFVNQQCLTGVFFLNQYLLPENLIWFTFETIQKNWYSQSTLYFDMPFQPQKRAWYTVYLFHCISEKTSHSDLHLFGIVPLV